MFQRWPVRVRGRVCLSLPSPHGAFTAWYGSGCGSEDQCHQCQQWQQWQQQHGLEHRHLGEPPQRRKNMYDHPWHPLSPRTGKQELLRTVLQTVAVAKSTYYYIFISIFCILVTLLSHFNARVRYGFFIWGRYFPVLWRLLCARASLRTTVTGSRSRGTLPQYTPWWSYYFSPGIH